jgi:hypothetical protein
VTADRTQSLKDTVGAAQAFDAAPIAGKMSGDYAATQEANASRIAERTRRAIEQLSAMGAPGEQAAGLRPALRPRRGQRRCREPRERERRARLHDDISNVKPDPLQRFLSNLQRSAM